MVIARKFCDSAIGGPGIHHSPLHQFLERYSLLRKAISRSARACSTLKKPKNGICVSNRPCLPCPFSVSGNKKGDPCPGPAGHQGTQIRNDFALGERNRGVETGSRRFPSSDHLESVIPGSPCISCRPGELIIIMIRSPPSFPHMYSLGCARATCVSEGSDRILHPTCRRGIFNTSAHMECMPG